MSEAFARADQLKKDKRMSKKKNGCKITVDFKCDYYNQRDCDYFKLDDDMWLAVKSTRCESGLYKRPCFNSKAKKETLSIFIKQFLGENDA